MSKLLTNSSLFTSESVCAGHPDKIADAISDSLLDSLLEQDPNSRTGIETLVGNNNIILAGEISSQANVKVEEIVRNKITELGYTTSAWGFSNKSKFTNLLHQQSPDIALGVDTGGAGDQGMMFGYAVNQTSNYLPMPITIAHAITKALDQARITKTISWLRPDGKSQVTVRFENDQPVGVEKLVVAIAHSESVDLEEVRETIFKEVLAKVLAEFNFELPRAANIIVNGTGRWHIPGPSSDAGLTGRKIVVDGYGGFARVGGGAFSGKDPSKVDRSGAYAARYIAKNIVANKLADKCEVALAYAIGSPYPLMQTINTFETNKLNPKAIADFCDKLLDTSVNGIIDHFKLKRPIYSKTSAYGHFGKEDLPWEKVVQL